MKITVLCIGAQMVDALSDQGFVPQTTFFQPASVDGIGRLANLLTRHLDDRQHDRGSNDMAVSLAYFRRDGDYGQRPEMMALLPLDRDLVQELRAKPWISRSLPPFSMPVPELFQALIRNHVFASLFRAAVALVTENAARLALMSQAGQSVDDRSDTLTSEARSVRQSEITTELLDVIIGFEALKKQR